jgi:hypothetical protein
MTQFLALIDVAGIQEYIFGSNDLGQNIGASELVALATRDWVFDALNTVSLSHNGDRKQRGKHVDWKILDMGITSVDALVIYAGGGNAAILFKDLNRSRQFIAALSGRALRDAPELRLACVHEEFELNHPRGVRIALDNARRRIGERNERQPASTPLLGLGVTATCDFTARPVYDLDDEGTPISRMVRAKLDARNFAENHLRDALRDAKLLRHDDDFIFNFDDFGEPNESSYIALIHADGNGMGERIKALQGADNEAYVRSLRAFSASVQDAAQKALCMTVDALLTTRRQVKGDDYFGAHSEIKPPRKRLPFRPVVFGGDDVTFVADGRLGLALARTYLNALLAHAPKLSDEEPLYSRIGIAVVKNHYPFSRAYRLAESLSKSAREACPTWSEHPHPLPWSEVPKLLPWHILPVPKPGQRDLCELYDLRANVMDWHFFTSGAVLDLDTLRAREYTAQYSEAPGNLLMRPIRLQKYTAADWRTWDVFRYFTHQFLWDENNWQGRRNKVKALRDALRAGPDTVKQFLENYQPPNQRRLPYLGGFDALADTGWEEDKINGRCGYFDSIEAMDFFVELEAGA